MEEVIKILEKRSYTELVKMRDGAKKINDQFLVDVLEAMIRKRDLNRRKENRNVV